MRTLAFPTSTQVDWSYRIGLSLVVLFGFAEIVGLGYYYGGGARTRRAAAEPALALTAPTPAAAALAPSARPTAAAAPSRAATAPPATSTVSVADRLLKEATALRERGDTTTALMRLQEASQRDPSNAQVLAEMATLYESIQLYDRSNETWRKIEEIGPAAGNLYELAETKLKVGAAAPAVAASAPPTIANAPPNIANTPPTLANTPPSIANAPPTLANAAPAVTPVPPPPATTPITEAAAQPRTGTEGIPEGATLGISDVLVTETPDADAETNLQLRISIKARPNTVIDHTKVTIRVYFYDTVGDSPQPVLTDAQTNHEWLTPNHDWTTTNPEILAVSYFRPKNQAVTSETALSAAAAAVVPGKKPKPTTSKSGFGSDTAGRHYLGYIVRIYYNDKLQAQRAQPTKLLALFPSPGASP